MNDQSKPVKLTRIQRDVLEALNAGAMIAVDKMNLTWIGERQIHSQTRTFLTDNRLITRLDKTKNIEAKGNGFTISKMGVEALVATQ